MPIQYTPIYLLPIYLSISPAKAPRSGSSTQTLGGFGPKMTNFISCTLLCHVEYYQLYLIVARDDRKKGTTIHVIPPNAAPIWTYSSLSRQKLGAEMEKFEPRLEEMKQKAVHGPWAVEGSSNSST